MSIKTLSHWIAPIFYLTRTQATFQGSISYAIKMAKLTFIFCFSICFLSIMAEPQCSPFHYHEQLLEKMVDVQHKMGIYSEKIEKWESAIDEKLSKLEDKMEQQAELERTLTTFVNNKIEQQAQLEKNLIATVNDTLAEFKLNLPKELLHFQGTVFLVLIQIYSCRIILPLL